jgi:general nucleoside transport system ATP-binding protein
MAVAVGLSSGTNWPVTGTAPALALTGIHRRFGSVRALDNATLSVARGEVHALLGENGAGKSTLMKIAFGLDQPDLGTLEINGARTVLKTPRDAMRLGIGMVQQHFTLVAAMTVAENVALGGGGRLDLARTKDMIRRISEESGLPLDPDARVRDLSVNAQQRLEIVKALAQKSSILILDEPTAVLSPPEAAELLSWTKRFTANGGTVILIAHKLREVLSVADRVTVLRRGTTVLAADASSVTEASLADAMLGSTTRHTAPPAQPRSAPREQVEPAVLELRDVGADDDLGYRRLISATLSVHAGELVGIAAIEGSGHHELLRVLAGRLAPAQGLVRLPDEVGFVPEDRHRDAVVLAATLTENAALRGAGKRRGLLSWNALKAATQRLMRFRDVRGDDESVPMRSLSGGNQQKFVLGRELADAPKALIVENPTRGLDIRATEDVHTALRAARDSGAAIVVYSSDLDEVLALADRVVVVSAGHLLSTPADRESVGRAMLAGVPT